MKKMILPAIGGLVLLLIAAVAAVVILQRGGGPDAADGRAGESLSAGQWSQRARQALAAHDPREAYDAFRHAASLEPANAEIQWEAARLASLLGDRPLLRAYAGAAWEGGRHDAQVLFMLLSTYDGSDAYLRRKGQDLLDSVRDPALKKELLGELTFRTGNTRRGIELLRAVYEEKPDPRVATKLARMLFLAGDRPGALTLLEEVRVRGGLTDEMLDLYLTAAVFSDDYDRADAVLETIGEPGDADESLLLKRAVFRMAQGNYEEAGRELESLRKRLAAEAGAEGVHPLAGTVRLYLAFLAALDGDPEAVQELRREAEADGARAGAGAAGEAPAALQADPRRLEGEQKLYAFLAEQDEARGWELLREARLLLPGEPVSTFFSLRHAMFNGRFEEGVELFRTIRNDDPRRALDGTEGMFYRNPVFLVTVAEGFARNGQADTALALAGWLHDRGLASRRSIQLIRDLTYARQQPDRSRGLQQALAAIHREDAGLAFQGAILDMNTGHLEASLKALDGLLREKPESMPVQVARIEVLMRQGRSREALEACEAVRIPEDKRWVLRARIHEQAGEPARAEEAYRQSLRLNDRPTAQLEFANFLLARGRADEASAIYRALLENKPGDPASLLGLASIDLEQGRTGEARARVQRILEENRRIEYAYILLAKIDLVEGRSDEALLECERALALSPGNAYARFLKAQARVQIALARKEPMDRKVNLLVAEQELAACDRLYPENLQILTARLLVKINLEAHEDALDIADRLWARDPGNVFLAKTRAELLSRLGRDRELAEALARLDRILPEEEGLLFRASLLVSAGKVDEALARLEPHLDRPAVAYRWALLAPLAGTEPGRVARTVSGLELDPARWFALGVAAEEAGRFPLAVTFYRRALELAPDAPEALNNFAWCSLKAGAFEPREVADAARRAHEKLPENPAVLDTYAAVLLACGQPAESVRLLRAHDGLVRSRPGLLLTLARALEAAGDPRAAAQAYGSLAAYGDDALPPGIDRAQLERKLRPQGDGA